LPIDDCALRGPDLYAILYVDRRARCLPRAVRLGDVLDDAPLGDLLAYATTSGKRFKQTGRDVPEHFL
jgi:hypothetical protein